MLLVAVDIGNTNVVIGFLDDGHIAGTYRITTKSNHTSVATHRTMWTM